MYDTNLHYCLTITRRSNDYAKEYAILRRPLAKKQITSLPDIIEQTTE